MISMHQSVRVIRDVPAQRVTKGMVGAVIEVFEVPKRAFEVEFIDAEGRPVVQATLTEDDLEAVSFA
ncbi:DUF4926 domain-containing protein [Corallococcus exiguus]|uniref:DUF4926 domain-containing protein n=1 Tax=Corallococcus TaxID=83461 RepID=UPI000EF03FF4|nr:MULTISPECIES: DUF4926 domain-containing protein [Corallococcus]NRD53693.1 DUF4926 domain-containing protein [Corallococcus exiguus]NRD61843.1 DUF4926 domain-containing protein [Corallococcus exiguus]RKI12138.1 DUF4926 domain-containing protein [Corallococcus sp. AB030]RUO92332.1 DUF4926 domain-containing protein [Corallococcus sp. AB018]